MSPNAWPSLCNCRILRPTSLACWDVSPTVKTVGCGPRGRTDVPKIVDWYMEGKIEIDPMITHTLSLDEINTGFDLMHEGKSIRSVVVY